MATIRVQDGTMIEFMGDQVLSAVFDSDLHGNLKPCPFCGERTGLEVCNTHTPSFWVECGSCGAEKEGVYENVDYSLISFDAKCDLYIRAMKTAVSEWNRRESPNE